MKQTPGSGVNLPPLENEGLESPEEEDDDTPSHSDGEVAQDNENIQLETTSVKQEHTNHPSTDHTQIHEQHIDPINTVGMSVPPVVPQPIQAHGMNNNGQLSPPNTQIPQVQTSFGHDPHSMYTMPGYTNMMNGQAAVYAMPPPQYSHWSSYHAGSVQPGQPPLLT